MYSFSLIDADINECLEENGGCMCDDESNDCSVCVNVPGSHLCECLHGYILDSDGLTCSGK